MFKNKYNLYEVFHELLYEHERLCFKAWALESTIFQVTSTLFENMFQYLLPA